MPTKKAAATSPITVDLPLSLIGKIEVLQGKLGLGSASETVREAVARLDMGRLAAGGEPHRQISVRLPVEMKERLVKIAKRKKTSVGAILRLALESCDAKPAKKGGRQALPADQF